MLDVATVHTHHWAAEVDSALGVNHSRTLARQEIVDFIEDLGLRDVVFHDFADLDSEPMDETAIQRGEDTIDRYLERAKGASNDKPLQQRGEELRRRLHQVDVQREPVVVIVGEKE